MKSVLPITLLILLALLATPLAGCSSVASGGAAANPTETLSLANQLALGTLKLDETAYPISQTQAAELLPLWKALRTLSASDTASTQEVDALVKQIQIALSAEQQTAIAAMKLSSADLTALIGERGPQGMGASGTPDASMQATRQARIESAQQSGAPGAGMGGGPGGGMGGGAGGGFGGTRPEGELPPEGGFGAGMGAQSTGTPGEWRQNTSGINIFLVNMVIQFLEAK